MTKTAFKVQNTFKLTHFVVLPYYWVRRGWRFDQLVVESGLGKRGQPRQPRKKGVNRGLASVHLGKPRCLGCLGLGSVAKSLPRSTLTCMWARAHAVL